MKYGLSAEDAQALADKGFGLTDIYAKDIFGFTHHEDS